MGLFSNFYKLSLISGVLLKGYLTLPFALLHKYSLLYLI